MTKFPFVIRTFARNPGFVIPALLCLTLGLGFSTGIAAIAEAVLHPVVPYANPGALYSVRLITSANNPSISRFDLFVAMRDVSFAESVGYAQRRGATLSVPSLGLERTASIARVSANFFEVLDVRPVMGILRARDRQEPSFAVISYETWRSVFGGSTSVLGAVIEVGGVEYPIAGVAPRGTDVPRSVSLWVVESGIGSIDRRLHLQAVVRLRPSMNAMSAAAELNGLGRRLGGERRGALVGYEVLPVVPTARGLHDQQLGLVFASLVVLLIGSLNVSTLLLARGASSRKEWAIRLALGANPRSIVIDRVVEGLVLSVLGCLLGGTVCLWSLDLFAGLVPSEFGSLGLVRPLLSWRVVGLVGGAVIGSVLISAAIPALFLIRRVALVDTLRTVAASSMPGLRWLVAGELALATALVFLTGLLLESARRAAAFDFGFDASRVAVGYFNNYADTSLRSRNARGPVFRDLVRRAEAVPGVSAAAVLGMEVPPNGGLSSWAAGRSTFQPAPWYVVASPAVLRTLSIPIVRGRDFVEGDEGAAVVDQLAAERLWPGAEPVGQMIKLGSPGSSAPTAVVVGVSRSSVLFFDDDADVDKKATVFYVPRAADPMADYRLIARSSQPAVVTAGLLRQRLSRPGIGVGELVFVPWLADFESFLRTRLLLVSLLGGFALCGLLLAVIGLAAVLSYSLSTRQMELAVRCALGASRRALTIGILREMAVVTLAGVAAGALLALGSGRLVRSMLYDTEPTSAAVLIAAELLTCVTALIAAFWPAWRAAGQDPAPVLRGGQPT